MWWRSRNKKDSEIIRRVLQGRRDEFGLLVERYLPAVQAVAYAHTGNRADAQDIAQETFLTAYQRLHTLREVGSLGAWFTTIARNTASHLTRQRQRRSELLDLHGSPQPEVVSTEPARRELLDLLHRQIQTLPEDHREVLLLHYFAGKKVREIAELQELSTDAVKKRLQRAREALSASMSEHVKGLLEPDSERKKESNRIMGLVALSSPTWHVTAEAAVGVSVSAVGAIALKFAVGAVALVVSGGLLWNWREPHPIDDVVQFATTSNASTSLPSGDESQHGPQSAVPPLQVAESTGQPRQPMLKALSDAATGSKWLSQPANDNQLSISGTVVGADGTPVPTAKVVVHIDDPYTHEEVEADANGRFAVGDLPQTHALHAVAMSPEDEPLLFESDVAGPFKLQDSGITGIVLSLDRPRNRTMSGVVVSADGNPMEGVGVLASAQRHRPRGGTTWTDARGQFSIHNLAAGVYKIGLSAPGHQSWRIKGNSPVYTVPVDTDLTDLVVTYDDFGTLSISGRITDIKGNPVSGARIGAKGATVTRESSQSSDREGRFTIDGLPSGDDYQVTVYHNGYTTQELSNISAGQTGVNFVLAGRGGVAGTVIDARTDRPIPAFEIGHSAEIPSARGTHYFGTRWESVENAEGEFSLQDLQSLWTNLYAKAAGYSPSQVHVEITPGNTKTGIILRLEPSRIIEGIVVDTGGAPITGALVLLRDRLPQGEDIERAAAARTAKDGRFRLDTVPTDVDSITVYHPDYAVQTVPLSGLPSEEVRVALEGGGSLSGLVRVGGEPVANADVALDYTGLPYPLTVNATTAPDGRYEFLHTQAGEAMLRVTVHPEHTGGVTRSIARTITVQAGAHSNLDIDFAALDASLEGVITAHGVPAGEGWVALECGDAENPEYIRTRTDDNGAYVLESVPSGPASLIVALNDGEQRRNKQMHLTIPSGTRSRWDVDFSGNAAIRALVQNAAAGVPVGIFVLPFVWEPPENATAAMLANFTGVETFPAQAVDSQGQCLFERMEAGTYTVVAVVGERIAIETIELRTDQSADVTLTLP